MNRDKVDYRRTRIKCLFNVFLADGLWDFFVKLTALEPPPLRQPEQTDTVMKIL